mgnify:CR=1 FL=1
MKISTLRVFIIVFKMVIVSAGVCDKIGKLVLSRQFKNLPKRTIDELYYSFPKLIKPHQQHTYIETDVMS